MTFKTLVTVAGAFWLLSCGASVLALYGSVKGHSKRPIALLLTACAGLLAGYFGLTFIHVKAWRTVNGHLEWSFNSRWFFLGAVVLGAISLALAVWNWRRSSNRKTTAPPLSEAARGPEDKHGASPNGDPALRPGNPNGEPPSMHLPGKA